LALGAAALVQGDDIVEGVLVCSERLCQREHPIVDGIPIVVADIASWSAHQLPALQRRDDLSAFTESLIGDAAGPQSEFHAERSNLGIYGWAHWGDAARSGDAEGAAAPRHGGAYLGLLDACWPLLDAPPQGAWIDVGCAVGRGTVELARRGAGIAVGVDLGFAMLRVAERVRRSGRARYPLRRGGLVFDRCDVAVADVPAERIAYWCCDAAALPFADAAFAGALLLNVVDCVPAPLALLAEAGRLLAPGAAALYASPYDWSTQATPVSQWLGGAGQRGPARGSSAAELRRILSPDRAAGVDLGLVIESELEAVPWNLRTGDRAAMAYAVHAARLRRR
ncbi:MAG: methyltransferase domain-containing protein, partial [Burkholderiales bacterium]|nr:methyltransferase domain-containing protein [Burkholderiales bacterium]